MLARSSQLQLMAEQWYLKEAPLLLPLLLENTEGGFQMFTVGRDCLPGLTPKDLTDFFLGFFLQNKDVFFSCLLNSLEKVI